MCIFNPHMEARTRLFYLTNCRLQFRSNTNLSRLRNQHVDNILRAIVTKQLSKCFLVISDVVAGDHCHKIMLSKLLKRRFTKMRIARKEVFRRCINIGEIAATASRDADFLCQFSGVIEQPNRTPALPSLYCTH